MEKENVNPDVDKIIRHYKESSEDDYKTMLNNEFHQN